jgi:tetraprenyl-beta-curcumene synthase
VYTQVARHRPAPGRAGTLGAFLSAAARYWIGVFPAARIEIARLKRRAQAIPDPRLRALALDAQRRKWASLEGAAAFAAFVDSGRRGALARLLVRLQAIFDYADTLMEQPCDRPAENARCLHAAFLAPFEEDAGPRDYYRHHRHGGDDGGYLADLVERCRAAVGSLPSYRLVDEAVRRNAARVVFYQGAVILASPADRGRLAGWSRAQAPSSTDMEWWEIAAASGSSLAVFALLAAAADPRLEHAEVEAIERLYWPWAESLHILLDSLVDRVEDIETGQPSLLDHYSSTQEMARRLEGLTVETFRRTERAGHSHRLIVLAMIALYLSDAQAWTPFARPIAERILAVSDGLVAPALVLLRARRLAPP